MGIFSQLIVPGSMSAEERNQLFGHARPDVFDAYLSSHIASSFQDRFHGRPDKKFMAIQSMRSIGVDRDDRAPFKLPLQISAALA